MMTVVSEGMMNGTMLAQISKMLRHLASRTGVEPVSPP
jgi:hypothetical protein